MQNVDVLAVMDRAATHAAAAAFKAGVPMRVKRDIEEARAAVAELIAVCNRAEYRLLYVNAHGAIRSGNEIDADLVIDLRRALARVQGGAS